MTKLKEDLYKETNNLENILDEFRNIYKPRDIGTFLLDIEQVNSLLFLFFFQVKFIFFFTLEQKLQIIFFLQSFHEKRQGKINIATI